MPIFTNYENISTSYCPGKPLPPNVNTREIKVPLAQYNVKNELIGFTWNQTDTINLQFIVSGSVQYDDGTFETPDVYFNNKEIQLEIFDFRYECVYSTSQTYQTSEESDNAIVSFYIGPECNIAKGTYGCKLTLIDSVTDEETQETTLTSTITLINIDDYKLTVR